MEIYIQLLPVQFFCVIEWFSYCLAQLLFQGQSFEGNKIIKFSRNKANSSTYRMLSILKIMTWKWYFQTFQVDWFTCGQEKLGRSGEKKFGRAHNKRASVQWYSIFAESAQHEQANKHTNTRTLYHSIDERCFLWHFNIQNWERERERKTSTHTYVTSMNTKLKTSFSSLAIIIVNTSHSISSALHKAQTMIKLPK